MYRFDYHLHTRHSMDCEMSLDLLCRTALAVGLSEICITDHTDFGHPDPGVDLPPIMADLLADVECARRTYPRLLIRLGIEIGDNPACRREIQAWHSAQPLDFRLLSLHLVDNMDPYNPLFYAQAEQDALYRRYAQCKLESALAWPADSYDAFAHLGYCAKFAPYPISERPLRYRHAPDAFDELFKVLAQNGKALEINTSGRKTLGECIPDRELLFRFRELGGEFVTIGSDAHLPAFVGKWTDDARALARSCGLRYALTFAQRLPIPIVL